MMMFRTTYRGCSLGGACLPHSCDDLWVPTNWVCIEGNPPGQLWNAILFYLHSVYCWKGVKVVTADLVLLQNTFCRIVKPSSLIQSQNAHVIQYSAMNSSHQYCCPYSILKFCVLCFQNPSLTPSSNYSLPLLSESLAARHNNIQEIIYWFKNTS